MEGFGGRPRDKTRRSRIRPLGADAAERGAGLTPPDPLAETARRTGAVMAAATGVSVTSAQHIRRVHGLLAHRVQ